LKHLSMLLQSAETIVDVFDRYDLKDSIKSAERERRSQAAIGHRIYHVNEGSSYQLCLAILLTVPQYNKKQICDIYIIK
jgi:hypothetical protein